MESRDSFTWSGGDEPDLNKWAAARRVFLRHWDKGWVHESSLSDLYSDLGPDFIKFAWI